MVPKSRSWVKTTEPWAKPLGTLPVHRPAPPINDKNDRLRKIVLKDLAAQGEADKTRGVPARGLASLLGKNWKDVWAVLQPQGVTVVMERAAKDGRVEYVVKGKNHKSASFTVRMTNGRIDEVEAWSPYELNTTALLVAEFARIRRRRPPEFLRIRLQVAL